MNAWTGERRFRLEPHAGVLAAAEEADVLRRWDRPCLSECDPSASGSSPDPHWMSPSWSHNGAVDGSGCPAPPSPSPWRRADDVYPVLVATCDHRAGEGALAWHVQLRAGMKQRLGLAGVWLILCACGEPPATLAGEPVGDALPGDSDSAVPARDLFEVLEPALVAGCAGCHEEAPAPFLALPDRYASAVGWPGVIAETAEASILLTYPRNGTGHTGTNLDAADLAETVLPDLRAWLAAEVEERAKPHPTIGPVDVQMGFNGWPLDGLADGLEGSYLTFDATEIGATLLKITSLEVHVAPGSDVHVVHPLFGVVDAAGAMEPDPMDSLSEVDERLDAGEASELPPGVVVLTHWAAGSRLSLGFEVIEPLQ